MGYENIFEKLGNNPKNVSDEAVRLLIKIADNLINNPTNLKIRTLNKENTTFSNKILLAKGAIDCLKMMGFQESDKCFTIPSVSIEKITEVRNAILMWKDSLKYECTVADVKVINVNDVSSTEEYIKPVVLPPLVSVFSNPFLKQVETYFHNCLQYENKDLQTRARKLIPLSVLEDAAQIRLRELLKFIKKNGLEDPDLSFQDALILELLKWFKEDFFSWVDSPECSECAGKTHFSHMSTDPKFLIYTNRVELHRCEVCRNFTAFPRYNDLNILLETRKGRCGEWANTFTLFCRAMDWDARFVVDESDHVWTEVYSITQQRWLHCDPCENLCDSPLIYEHGWHKKISYVTAYSKDEVQDVTWRYTSHHKEVLKNRKNCSEQELIDCLIKLRAHRQKEFSEPRKKYLTKRLLMELVEFLTERKPSNDESEGRTSGSAAWRLARGEIQEVGESSYIWIVKSDHIFSNKVTLRYSASLDSYEYSSGGRTISKVGKWYAGAFSSSDLFRKVERDWKQVYIARKEGTDYGVITWRVDIESSDKVLNRLILNFDYATYENGIVSVEICSEDHRVLVPQNEKMLETEDFRGAKSITVTATLRGGKGDVAWQHAQLFRQAENSKEYPFSLTLVFK